MDDGKVFNCKCGGEIRVIRDDYIWHTCNGLLALKTFGPEVSIPYRRVQIIGTTRYNWFVDWREP